MAWQRLRALPALLLVLLVLLLHLLLIGGLLPASVSSLGQDPGRGLPAPSRALQLLPPAPPLPGPAAAAPGPAPAAPEPTGRGAAMARSDAAPLPPPDAAPMTAAVTTAEALRPGLASDEDRDAAEPADAEPPAAGQPPPVYPTRVPLPVALNYRLRMNDQVGQARLVWQHSDGRYQLSLSAWGPAGPWLEQRSEGGFDAAGLAPERFIDRRRGRAWRSANFQRERGLISFSGPRLSYPAWPGAQDRLSWIAQLAAISAATSASPAAEPGPTLSGLDRPSVAIFVVDARGLGDVWQLHTDAEQMLGTALGPVRARPWQREPPRPEGLRVQAWLDPTRGHWPVLLRLTALRSGALFELTLADEPGLPP